MEIVFLIFMVLNIILGGMASLVVGYPLDTVKVRLQTDDKRAYTGGFDCFKKIIKNEGPLALFRGMSGLFVFATPRLALIFHGNSIGLRCIRGAFDEDPRFGYLIVIIIRISNLISGDL